MWIRFRRLIDRAVLLRAVVSLVLAFTLWGWVTIENNPEVIRLVPGISPTVTHLAPNLQVTGQLPTIALRLQGPRSEFDSLDPTKLRATVNLSNVHQAGDVTVPVQASAPGHIDVLDIYPPTILLHVELAPSQSNGTPGTVPATVTATPMPQPGG